MRIAVVVEYAEPLAWQAQGPWAGVIGGGLAAAGHAVTLLADGVWDAAVFERLGMHVEVRRPGRRSIDHDAIGFRRWVDGRVRTGGFDGVVSLARVWSCLPDAEGVGRVWIPTGRTAGTELRRLLAIRNPASLVMQGSHRLWIGASMLAERRARVDAAAAGVSASVPGGDLPAVGRFAPADCDAPSRDELRRLLGICDARFGSRSVLAVSRVHFEGFGIGHAAKAVAASDADRRPVILAAGGGAHAITAAFERAGAPGCVVALGPTARMDLVMRAADAVWVPGPPAGSAGEQGTGRLIPDALRLGVPVLAGAGAVNADLVGEAGLVVARDDWSGAFDAAGDADRLGAMRIAAERASPGLDPMVLVRAIEARLGV